VGWIQPPHSQQNGLDQARPSDYSLPDADPALTYGNVDLSGVIDNAAEAAAQAGWIAKVGTDGITVGPVNVLQYVPAGQSGSSSPNGDLGGAAVPAAPVASTTPTETPPITETTPAAPKAPKSKPVSLSKAVTSDTTHRKWKAWAVTTYAASVATIPSAGPTATGRHFDNKDAKFLADR